MAARSKARKRALDVLYAAELRGETPVDALARIIADGEAVPHHDYTAVIVRGVTEHLPEIDQTLSDYSQAWTIDRMPAVDRNVLRIGVWELLHADDVPDTVVVSEAMALVGDLSTDESPQFVNGVLAAITRDKPTA